MSRPTVWRGKKRISGALPVTQSCGSHVQSVCFLPSTDMLHLSLDAKLSISNHAG